MAICKNCGKPLILSGGRCIYCGNVPEGKALSNGGRTVSGSGLPPVRTFTINGVSFNMILVEGGTFWMGEQKDNPSKPNYDPEADGNNVNRESVETFYIAETVVTVGLVDTIFPFQELLKSYNYHRSELALHRLRWEYKDNMNLPAFIRCADQDVFISELIAETGCYFRYPTEKEWEFAARGGNKGKGYRFSGSNMLKEVGWYAGNCYSKNGWSDFFTLHAVKQKKPNELGLYDMSGLVNEFCYDGSHVILRGGDYTSTPNYCRISCRTSYKDYNYRYGLRLAMTPKTGKARQ